MKALAYIRVSTNKQDISPELQKERIEDYCRLQKLELFQVVTEVVSAKIHLSKRPEGRKINELVKSGITHIVALKLDRLFRNMADAMATIEQWNKAGIRLHLVDLGGGSVDTGSSMGKMFLTMLAAFAEFERNVISERTTAAMRHLKSQGRKTGGHVPYGFDCVGGGLAANPVEQAVLERLRNWRRQKKGYSACALELNALGIPSKTGGRWHPFSVQTVLKQNFTFLDTST